MSRLALKSIHFGYPGRPVLTGVELSFAASSVSALVGPNGAGKSTLLRIAAGILAPDAGQALVDDEPTMRASRRTLARTLAYVPQEFAPAFPFRVGELVLMGRYPHRGFARLESDRDLALARAAMERADIWPLRDRRYDQLSGGERRRVLLAQAFCQETPVLLLDEPTAALDPAHALSVFETLRAERDARGTTVVMATHDLNLAARFADRVLILADGQIVADGAPQQVLASEAASRAFSVALHVGVLPSGAAFVVPA